MGCTFERQKSITNTKAFQEILDESGRKPNQIWVDKGSEFYNGSMKSWLQDNDMKCIQHVMKKNVQWLKDLLEP